MLGKRSTTELYPQPQFYFLKLNLNAFIRDMTPQLLTSACSLLFDLDSIRHLGLLDLILVQCLHFELKN